VAARIVDTASSSAFLAEDPSLRRLPRRPGLARPEGFGAAFEDQALAYDCFWHGDGRRVLIVGPPPVNLWPHYRTARYAAGATALRVRYHRSLSVMVTELDGVPADATEVTMALGGEQRLPIRPSHVADFAGSRLLFSINKNNELAWIGEWARYHAAVHGTDAVVLFDNGSTRYAPAEIAATLAAVPGLTRVAVPSWPHKFGPIDRTLRYEPFWSRFLQIASMSVLLRRFGMKAFGLLNCDIDELAAPASPSIYDQARQSRGGLVTFRGQWVEAATAEGAPTHRSFTQRLRDPERRLSRPRKWVLDPSRSWVGRLNVHPYWHFIKGRPLLSKSSPPELSYWHFRGINTGWKRGVTVPPAEALEADAPLRAAFERADRQK
jgi:hypothetical protein